MLKIVVGRGLRARWSAENLDPFVWVHDRTQDPCAGPHAYGALSRWIRLLSENDHREGVDKASPRSKKNGSGGVPGS